MCVCGGGGALPHFRDLAIPKLLLEQILMERVSSYLRFNLNFIISLKRMAFIFNRKEYVESVWASKSSDALAILLFIFLTKEEKRN